MCSESKIWVAKQRNEGNNINKTNMPNNDSFHDAAQFPCDTCFYLIKNTWKMKNVQCVNMKNDFFSFHNNNL